MSILAAILILVSGMQLSLSTHLCSGDITAVKWSFNGAKASCGMHDNNLPEKGKPVFKTDCCHNNNFSIRVDKHYNPSYNFNPGEITRIASVYLLIDDILPSTVYSFLLVTSQLVFPEKDLLAGGVSLPALCIFRI